MLYVHCIMQNKVVDESGTSTMLVSFETVYKTNATSTKSYL